ncbi:MAG: CHAT domain-containing protein, partial [Chloroflexi bacterium]|nr:CHAT domain-containing protein [Chloroflexota bacterium]
LLRALFYLQSNHPIDPTLFDALSRAQAAFAQHDPVLEEGLALILLGRCHLRGGQWATARQSFESAQALVEKGADRALGYRILYGLGEVERAQKHPESAIGYYRAAIQQIESIRYELQIETFRAGFLTDKIEIYQDLADLHLEMGDLDLAFQVVEWAKSRLVTEKLAFRLTTEVRQAINSDDEQIRALAQQLAEALQTLDGLYNQVRLETMQSREDISLAPPRQTTILVAALETTVQTLVQQIQRRQPLFSALTAGYASSLANVQDCLQAAIFLQYHIIKDQVFVFIVDRFGIQHHRKLGSLSEIDNARHAFITAVERLLEISVRFGPQKTLRYLPALLDDANKHLKTLHTLLMQPLLEQLPANRPLIIAPDGPLTYVPFHALYDGQAYLIEQRALSYTPSATILDLCTQHQVDGEGVLLFGYDSARLHSVSVELNRLALLFPTAELYSGEQATTTTFMARAPHHQRIHLAAHATFRADNPMLSSIALADRRLTLAEIARLQINAELVVLSGCETGYGQLHGTDLLSLAGGFLGAGARSLLVSLWRVEDHTTAALMQHFYQALLEGQTQARALQTAQLALLNQGRSAKEDAVYCHPAYWAPFTLVGKP